jgi:hypothetical protein
LVDFPVSTSCPARQRLAGHDGSKFHVLLFSFLVLLFSLLYLMLGLVFVVPDRGENSHGP